MKFSIEVVKSAKMLIKAIQKVVKARGRQQKLVEGGKKG